MKIEEIIGQAIIILIFSFLWFVINKMLGNDVGIIVGLATIYSYLMIKR